MRRRSCVMDSSRDMLASGGTVGGGGRSGCATVVRSMDGGGSGGAGDALTGGLLPGAARNGGSGSCFGSGDDWNADQAHLPDDESSAFCFCEPLLFDEVALLCLLRPFLDVAVVVVAAAVDVDACASSFLRRTGVLERLDARLAELLRAGATGAATAACVSTALRASSGLRAAREVRTSRSKRAADRCWTRTHDPPRP